MLKLFYIYNPSTLKRLRKPVKLPDPNRSGQVIGESHFVIHLFGKLRRFYLVHFRKKYVEKQLKLREGKCRQCGQCCALLYVCPMMTEEGKCLVYDNIRWEVCKVFPIDDKDIKEVALCGGRCGYSFRQNLLGK